MNFSKVKTEPWVESVSRGLFVRKGKERENESHSPFF